MQRFGKECEAEVKRVFPEILEEFKGFADGCNISCEELKAFIFMDYQPNIIFTLYDFEGRKFYENAEKVMKRRCRSNER